MKQSRLIQHLMPPVERQSNAFGGGQKNGGIPDEGMEILKPVFSFKYMGAAQYEHGAVAEALAAMWDCKELHGQAIRVKTRDLAPDPGYPDEKGGVIEGTVYVIAPKSMIKEACKRIKRWAHNDYGRQSTLRDSALLERSLRNPSGKYNPCGWLELDNGFMFFTNPKMFLSCAALFAAKEK